MKHLLIVSNDPLQTAIIATSLNDNNLQIITIGRDECLLDVCRNNTIDIIVFLTLHPYFSSMNIVEQLRIALGHKPSIFVVSNYHSAAVVMTLLECGVDQYLSFPLNLYRFRRKVLSEVGIS